MSEVSERVASRLENIKAIDPLLGSLRVISLSKMQIAINFKEQLGVQKQEYYRIVSYLLEHLSHNESRKLPVVPAQRQQTVLVIFGSERGICGPYNKNLAEAAQYWLNRQATPATILSLGDHLPAALRMAKLPFEHQGALSKGFKPQYQNAHAMIEKWIKADATGALKSFQVLSHRRTPKGFYKPVITQILPNVEAVPKPEGRNFTWPTPLIEGNPKLILQKAIDHLVALNFYELILESIVAENSLRYNLLEEAKSNIEELIDTLSIELQIARRQAVTQQILSLSVEAGLISNP